MTEHLASTASNSAGQQPGDGPLCTLHVCTSCRPPGAAREPADARPGFRLYQELREAFRENPLGERVQVKPAECLSICPRPCGIALSLPGSWTYLFGDQQPQKTTGDVVECVGLYLKTREGAMARDSRPKALRRSILGRVPPLPAGDVCT